MAGIFGIVKKHGCISAVEKKLIVAMQDKIMISSDQTHKIHEEPRAIFGNAVPLNHKDNDHYQYNFDLNITCVVDGLVFIEEKQKKTIIEQYGVNRLVNDYEYLPYLYKMYDEDIVYYLTGNYNIFFYDRNLDRSLLLNDRLGFLPLYTFEDSDVFVFSSKIESILSTRLLSEIEIDYSTIAEQLIFHHVLSDNTYIKYVKTLSNAQRISFRFPEIESDVYWSMDELFHFDSLNRSDSFDLLNTSLKGSLTKFMDSFKGKVNLSLTGGWDSRVILSYLLQDYKERLNLYSFGALTSSDIRIPIEIAKSEMLSYTPFILDQNYLDSGFLSTAMRTIMYSNGTRNFKRTHYLYAIEKLAHKTEYFISGIFGDEVLKVGKSSGGEVLSQNTIMLIEADFINDSLLAKLGESKILDLLPIDKEIVIAELSHRLEILGDIFKKYETIPQKFFALRFELNLRKYFGSEVNGYNDFAYSFSPFIDYDFLKEYAKTIFLGSRYDFENSTLAIKKQTTKLYSNLVNSNCYRLSRYNSSRGYSMSDANSIIGNIKILYLKYLRTNKDEDGYNTKPTEKIFHEFVQNNTLCYSSKILELEDNNFQRKADLYSLLYWISEIKKIYG